MSALSTMLQDARKNARPRELIYVAVSVVLGLTSAAFAVGYHATGGRAFVVNKTEVDLDIEVDGHPLHIDGTTARPIEFGAGSGLHTLRVLAGGKVLAEDRAVVPSGTHDIVYNPLGLSPVFQAYMVYSSSGKEGGPEPRSLGGKAISISDEVDYPFTTPPSSMSVDSKSGRLTKTTLISPDGGSRMLVGYALMQAGDRALALRLAEERLRLPKSGISELEFATLVAKTAYGTDAAFGVLLRRLEAESDDLEDAERYFAYSATHASDFLWRDRVLASLESGKSRARRRLLTFRGLPESTAQAGIDTALLEEATDPQVQAAAGRLAYKHANYKECVAHLSQLSGEAARVNSSEFAACMLLSGDEAGARNHARQNALDTLASNSAYAGSAAIEYARIAVAAYRMEKSTEAETHSGRSVNAMTKAPQGTLATSQAGAADVAVVALAGSAAARPRALPRRVRDEVMRFASSIKVDKDLSGERVLSLMVGDLPNETPSNSPDFPKDAVGRSAALRDAMGGNAPAVSGNTSPSRAANALDKAIELAKLARREPPDFSRDEGYANFALGRAYLPNELVLLFALEQGRQGHLARFHQMLDDDDGTALPAELLLAYVVSGEYEDRLWNLELTQRAAVELIRSRVLEAAGNAKEALRLRLLALAHDPLRGWVYQLANGWPAPAPKADSVALYQRIE